MQQRHRMKSRKRERGEDNNTGRREGREGRGREGEDKP